MSKMLEGRAHEQEPRRAPARPGDTSGTDPPPSPSLPVVVGGHIGDRPASVPVAARRRWGTHRGQTRLRPRHAARRRCTPPTVRRDLKVAAAPLTQRRTRASAREFPTKASGRSPAASPKGSPRCTRVEPTSKKRGAPLPVPKSNDALRATAPSPSRVAPARGIPMEDGH